MNRHGNLWRQVVSFKSLLHAAKLACKGKRFRPAVAAFHFNQERELWKLHEELEKKTYRPGVYRSFFIYQPKKRQISAAPYRDRVVHHALVNVLEPIYERSFIFDSYALPQGQGDARRGEASTGVRPSLPVRSESGRAKVLSVSGSPNPHIVDRPQDQGPGRAVADRPDHRWQQPTRRSKELVSRR